MQKFTNILASMIVFLIYFVVIFGSSFVSLDWNPFDYARITEVDYKAVVVDEPYSDGKVIITERLTFDVHASSKNNGFWELWRDLPETYVDGVKVEYQVKSVKQIFEDKPDIIYEQSPKLYWNDNDYINTAAGLGPGKWYHSKGPYNEDLRQYECVLFYVDNLYRDTVVFEIEYEMYNAALRYNDCSELYLSLYSGNTIKYLNSFKGQILFPNKIMPAEGNYKVHTYGTNSQSFPFTESKSINLGYHTFSFELNESQLKFRPYNQYIEFTLISHGVDKHIFTKYASTNMYTYSNVLSEIRQEQAEYDSLPNKYRTTKIKTLLLSLVATCLTITSASWIIKKIKKKYTFYEPEIAMEYFRDIPSNLDPNFASTLAFCKHKSSMNIQDGYASVMLSLVRKEYIELAKIKSEGDWVFKNIKIIVKSRPTSPHIIVSSPDTPIPEQAIQNKEPLTLTEEHYLNLIIRHSHGTEIPMNTFQKKISSDYENTYSFVNNVTRTLTNIGVSQGYFQNANYKEPKEKVKKWVLTFSILGILIITIVNIISYQTRLDLAFGAFFILGISLIVTALYLYRSSKKYILLTQFGEDEYAKWRGLYYFLNSETLMNERTVVELEIWEQYLIYATAFGISEKVIKALNIRCPNADTSPILRNPYYRSRAFYHSSHSFRSATRTASYTARSGGHGGYGGGGRGGGGGRRRALAINNINF